MANLQRIRTGSTGSLTPKERESLHELVKEYNSDFRAKAATVPFVGDILPEAGVIVISNHDGRMYRADQQGWNLMGVDSPIMLFVDFDGTTQFVFKFKAPSTSTLNIYDGDGTMSAVAGQDDTEVTHTTTYSEAGTYTFYVEGDYLDLTFIDIGGQLFVSGDITGWVAMVDLTHIEIAASLIYGDISAFDVLTGLVALKAIDCPLVGDFTPLGFLPNLTDLTLKNTNVTGDFSSFGISLANKFINSGISSTFNSVSTLTAGLFFFAYDCNWTSTMVDNCLISLSNGSTTGCNISIGGTNAARTSASDAAMVTLEAAGNTVTVNE